MIMTPARNLAVISFLNFLLIVHSSDFCENYAIRCQLHNKIVCRELVGGVVGTFLQSARSLSCPYRYEARSFSWTFLNSTHASVPLAQQNMRSLSLNKVDRSTEGVYTCTVTMLNDRVYMENTQIFLYVAGHAYFHSCPEAVNGRNCTITQHLQAVINRNVVFDTGVAYRDGGACGKKQDIRYMSLRKEGRTVYFCANVGVFTKYKCPNNSRFIVAGQREDKFDFQLTMKNVVLSDAGDYELELSLADAEGYRAVSIYRKYSLLISESLPTMAPESTTAEPHCNGSSDHQVPGAMLIFLGEVLSNGTNITAKSLGKKERALLCAVLDEHCCTSQQGAVDAHFLWPNGTIIEDAPGNQLYTTRGKQMILLNSMTSNSEVESGMYCCTFSSQNMNSDPLCVHLI